MKHYPRKKKSLSRKVSNVYFHMKMTMKISLQILRISINVEKISLFSYIFFRDCCSEILQSDRSRI